MLHQGSWQDLLLPPRPRDFPHLLQPTGSSGDSQRRALGSALQWPTPRIWQFPCQGEIAFREGEVFFFARKNHSSVNVAATPSYLLLHKSKSPPASLTERNIPKLKPKPLPATSEEGSCGARHRAICLARQNRQKYLPARGPQAPAYGAVTLLINCARVSPPLTPMRLNSYIFAFRVYCLPETVVTPSWKPLWATAHSAPSGYCP